MYLKLEGKNGISVANFSISLLIWLATRMDFDFDFLLYNLFFYISPCDIFCLILHIIIGLTKILCAVLHPCLISYIMYHHNHPVCRAHNTKTTCGTNYESIADRTSVHSINTILNLVAVCCVPSTPTAVVSHDVVALM